MFDSESENMNNTTLNVNNNGFQSNLSTMNSQAISLIKDLNVGFYTYFQILTCISNIIKNFFFLLNLFQNFNHTAIEKNSNINQQIINTSSKIASVRSMNNNNSSNSKQLTKHNNSKQQLIIDQQDDIINAEEVIGCEDDDSGSQSIRNTSSQNMSGTINNGNLDDSDTDILQVNCNSIVASLHKKKFGSGGKGRCINLDNKWMTPIEFEQYCGKGNCRDWKRTIKCGGQQLLTLLDNNVLLCHAVSCSCSVCSNDSNVVGPIRPFLRYRRRKRDEIMAQNAYKKFLSLKPPTLVATNDFDRLHNHTNFLLNNINNTCNLIGGVGNGGLNHVKADYSLNEDGLSTISSTNSDYNMDNNNNNNHENSYQNHLDHLNNSNNNNVSNTNNGNNSVNINNQNNNSQISDYNDKNENNNFTYNVKLSNSVKEMQKLESEQWNLLEKV